MSKLTIERQGSNIVMRDEETKETAILDNQESAVSNFTSWIYARHLSGNGINNSHSFDLNKPRDVTERGAVSLKSRQYKEKIISSGHAPDHVT